MVSMILIFRNKLKFLLAILIHFILVNGYAQTSTISGRVIDSETNEGLPYANVFINQSTLGTATDENGNFSLLKIPYGVNELVVSYIGYTSYSTKVKSGPENIKYLEIRLVPTDAQLSEVQIKGERDKEWQANLKKFETIFLGTTAFAKSCEILNPWVLEFNADVNNTFYATASQPLEILNLALGYKIFYYLTGFISTKDAYNILGKIRFEELVTTDEKQALTWQQNRITAYLGSYRHLFKAIIEGRTKEEGFALYYHTANTSLVSRTDQSTTFASLLGNSIKQYTTDDIVKKELPNEEYQLQLSPKTEVHYTKLYSVKRVYKDISFPVSWLEIKDGMLHVAKNGVVLTPAKLIVSGGMYDLRMANLLPENYSQNDKVNIDKQVDYTLDKMIALQEKVYLHTDKEYYYPGETIWFKAYINYRSPEIMDSLSRVLYVELIGPDKNIISTQFIKIKNGMANGGFTISNQSSIGAYFIRSYTQWMLNYKSEGLFIKQLPVLNFSDRPVARDGLFAFDTTQLSIVTKKKTFEPRDKIDLEVTIKSDNPQHKLASLSVAVTDIDQVVNVPELTDIKRQFEFSNQPKITLPFQYEIEFGISLKGQHFDKKGKPEKASLLIMCKDYRNSKILDTNNEGTFWVTGFDIIDSTEVNFNYIKSIGKIGQIKLAPRLIPPLENLDSKLFFELEKRIPYKVRPIPDSTGKARLLKEVTIKASRMERSNEALAAAKVYGKAEITVLGADLFKSSTTSLADALRGRVPGFNILYNGANKFIRLGPKASFTGPDKTEPLLIIDGLQMAPGGVLSVYEQLQQISTVLVDRVDVIRFGGSAIYGSRGGNGVIIVYTKGGEFSFDQTNPNSNLKSKGLIKTYTILGYTPALSVLFPDYAKNEVLTKVVYDDRSTVYWNPLLETNDEGIAKFSFYAADLSTQYKVSIEGITTTGVPLRGVIYLLVKK